MDQVPTGQLSLARAVAPWAGIALLLIGSAATADAQARRARTPRPAAPSKTWTAVSAGSNHTCALDTDGRAFCWGENAWHRLGIADSVNIRRPIAVETPQRFRSISAGTLETCALTAEGGAVCWGGLYPGTPPRTAAGNLRFQALNLRSNSCAVSHDGIGWCWGSNGVGQLGNGDPNNQNATSPQRVADDLRWTDIRPTSGFACGLTSRGAAYCWGRNSDGQLGTGTQQGSNVPVPVAGGLTFQSIAVGAEHACALTAEGAAWCWGDGQSGGIGNGRSTREPTPQRVSGDVAFRQVTAGYAFTCGLATDGRAWCWGFNRNGNLGTGNRRGTQVPQPVTGRLTFASLSAGNTHVCGITTNGGLYCWGENSEGGLGVARAGVCRDLVDRARRQYDVRPCVLVPTRVQDPR
jgi:alpha-tubulin suppressor-like RCC1 family protein